MYNNYSSSSARHISVVGGKYSRVRGDKLYTNMVMPIRTQAAPNLAYAVSSTSETT